MNKYLIYLVIAMFIAFPVMFIVTTALLLIYKLNELQKEIKAKQNALKKLEEH